MSPAKTADVMLVLCAFQGMPDTLAYSAVVHTLPELYKSLSGSGLPSFVTTASPSLYRYMLHHSLVRVGVGEDATVPEGEVAGLPEAAAVRMAGPTHEGVVGVQHAAGRLDV